MSQSKKIFLGILTFLPLVLLLVYFFIFSKFFFAMVGSAADNPFHQDEMPVMFFANFFWMFVLIGLSALISLGIMIYYIIHANKNPRLDSNQKIMWTLILIFVNSIGSIVYYFMEIIPLKESYKT
ncbi:MAG TPA: PLDc N-terminal domain-containing protein [Flavobacteriaceae bacterium]|nr:PLDc N-terminal domain-containing protein [Flavobacteriaceae bacterium]